MTTDQRNLIDKTIEVRIGSVFQTYVVAYPQEDVGELTKDTSITFARSVWEGPGKEPKQGDVAVLADIYMNVKGWRARTASAKIPDKSTKHKKRRGSWPQASRVRQSRA